MDDKTNGTPPAPIVVRGLVFAHPECGCSDNRKGKATTTSSCPCAAYQVVVAENYCFPSAALPPWQETPATRPALHCESGAVRR